jgi:hypothetical protein
MNTKKTLSEYIKFRFEGYIVDSNTEVLSSNTFRFEFRNLGNGPVFINGIELSPAGPSGDNTFAEDFLDKERSFGQYKVVFGIGAIKKLLVIEKYPVLENEIGG